MERKIHWQDRKWAGIKMRMARETGVDWFWRIRTDECLQNQGKIACLRRFADATYNFTAGYIKSPLGGGEGLWEGVWDVC